MFLWGFLRPGKVCCFLYLLGSRQSDGLPETEQPTTEESPKLVRPGSDEIGLTDKERVASPRRRRSEAERRILFGQRRIGTHFSDDKRVPRHLRGRSLKAVAKDLRLGKLTTDDIEVEVFVNPENESELIAINNRSLAAVSLAGRKATNIKVVVPTGRLRTELNERLEERPLPTFPKLPAAEIAVTRSQDDLRVLGKIRVVE